MKRVTRYDSNIDPQFVQRVQAAFVSAEDAERALTGTGGISGAEAARLRMLGRMGLEVEAGSAADARDLMVQRRERKTGN